MTSSVFSMYGLLSTKNHDGQTSQQTTDGTHYQTILKSPNGPSIHFNT